MTTAQRNRFKKILEAKRSELLRGIRVQRARLAIVPASDPMDEFKSLAERDFAVKSMNQMTQLLRLVEGALGELREGTFGICADCGVAIPMKRLEAVPWSPYCVSCQERAERSQKQGSRSDYDAPYALAS
jgi:DnaK suppressor protein